MRKSPFLRVSVSPFPRFSASPFLRLAVSPVPCPLSPVPFLSPFTTRYSLLAVVSARQEPRPPISFRLPSHSKFGRANLPVSPKLLEGASPDAPKFFGSAEALPSKKPFATRRRFLSLHRFTVSPFHRVPQSIVLPCFPSTLPPATHVLVPTF